MKGYYRYFGKKMLWFMITLVAAFLLNFILPRMMPGDPVAVITQRATQGMTSAAGVQKVYEQYQEQFGTNKPMLQQFLIYVKNVAHGDFGVSFSQYPRPVADIIRSSVGWTVGLQLPAIIVGWIIGNLLGALAAYRKSGYDKVPHAHQSLYQQCPGVWYGHCFDGSFWGNVKMVSRLRGIWVRYDSQFKLVICLVGIRPLSTAILVNRAGHYRRSGDRHALHVHL